jgi:hypothetical protein
MDQWSELHKADIVWENTHSRHSSVQIKCFHYCVCFLFCFVLFLAVLGFELRAYTLSHSTSPFLGFFLR